MTSMRLASELDPPSFGLLGRHPSMIELFDAMHRAARLDAPIVIWGPTGSGKELVARAVHRLSDVGRGPFCPVNVAALPEGLVESELFGSVRGAYTGAVVDRVGLVESARGGSLFLDEAGDLPLVVQPKLLRLLEYGEVRRVGGTKTEPIPFHLLVAAQDNPAELCRAGRWRDDFYYRLTSVVLRVPSLRERSADIPDLVIAFMAKRRLPDVTPNALDLLQRYEWPGNVRELQQILLRAAFYADGRVIKASHVRRAIALGMQAQSIEQRTNLKAARCRHVQDIVAACAGDTKRASELLGISRRQVYRFLRARSVLGERPVGDAV